MSTVAVNNIVNSLFQKSIGKKLICCKIRKIKLDFLFISRFCTPAVLPLCYSSLFTKITVLWLPKSLLIRKENY